MGKKGSWLSAVKKALSSNSKEKEQRHSKSKKCLQKEKDSNRVPSSEADVVTSTPHLVEVTRSPHAIESDPEKHAHSVAMATAAAAEAAAVAAHAAAEVVRLTNMARYSGRSREEAAAIRIQTTFRGYLARRALRALRGLMRLKSVIQGPSAKTQSSTALKEMQTLSRLQSKVRARRIRMSEDNQAFRRQLQLKHEKELGSSKTEEEEWDVSTQSKEQIEANLQTRQEAAMRREKALAYARSHQVRRKSAPTDPSNNEWEWSWLERWMAEWPSEARTAASTDEDSNENAPTVKSAFGRSASSTGETTRSKKPSSMTYGGQRAGRPSNRQPPSTKSGKSNESPSERHRRHSDGGLSVKDHKSSVGSSRVPSPIGPTKSAKNRLNKPADPSGAKNGGTLSKETTKKRLPSPSRLGVKPRATQ